MSPIGGPGGIGGPKGPGSPDAATGVDDADGADALDGAEAARGAQGARGAQSAAAMTGPADITALSAEVAAGRLTSREAIDRLVDATAGSELGASERAELRELLTDLVANDPYLAGLANRA